MVEPQVRGFSSLLLLVPGPHKHLEMVQQVV